MLDIYNYEVEHGTATFDLHPKTMKERRTWFDEHPGGRYILLAAIEDGRAVGYASLSPYREKEAYAATVELSIYVDVAYAARHCGSADAGAFILCKSARGCAHDRLGHHRGQRDECKNCMKNMDFCTVAVFMRLA